MEGGGEEGRRVEGETERQTGHAMHGIICN